MQTCVVVAALRRLLSGCEPLATPASKIGHFPFLGTRKHDFFLASTPHPSGPVFRVGYIAIGIWPDLYPNLVSIAVFVSTFSLALDRFVFHLN